MATPLNKHYCISIDGPHTHYMHLHSFLLYIQVRSMVSFGDTNIFVWTRMFFPASDAFPADNPKFQLNQGGLPSTGTSLICLGETEVARRWWVRHVAPLRLQHYTIPKRFTEGATRLCLLLSVSQS